MMMRISRKPLLRQRVDVSIDAGAALLVAASLKRLQDERAAELASSAADEDGVYAGSMEAGGAGAGAKGGGAGGGGNGGSGGGGGGQEAQAAPFGFTLDQLHRELHGLLNIKVCLWSLCATAGRLSSSLHVVVVCLSSGGMNWLFESPCVWLGCIGLFAVLVAYVNYFVCVNRCCCSSVWITKALKSGRQSPSPGSRTHYFCRPRYYFLS